MNAGMRDSVNLAWKLSLVLRGIAKREPLETYDAVRKPKAEKLIKYDEDISVLVTGRLPNDWNGNSQVGSHIVLGRVLQEAKGFNTGMTIDYLPNELNSMQESLGKYLIPAPALPEYRSA
jgi:phenol 2-monooxygenase (NADPH)